MQGHHIKTVANYKILETLRETTEGILYKAVDISSGNNVLIKVYYPELVWSDAVLGDFFDKVSYLRFIEHQYLLPILEFGKYEDRPYIVYPLHSFRSISYNFTKLSGEKEVVVLLLKIAEALDFLHKQEILHGALNMGNILIESNGNPQLFDYGLTGVFKKLLKENIEDNFNNLCVSDVRSSSPEQLLGRDPTRLSDIYSFGMIFYFAIFGDSVFDGRQAPEIAIMHLGDKTTWLKTPLNSISIDTRRFIQKCIQIDPELRFASFAETFGILNRSKILLSRRKRFALGERGNLFSRIWLYIVSILFFTGIIAFFYLRYYNYSSPVPAPLTPIGTSVLISPIQKIMDTPSATSGGIQVEQIPGITTPTSLSPKNQDVFKPAFEGEISDIPSQVISVDNLGQIVEFSRLGYGKLEDADISIDTRYFALATSAGVFIYYENQLMKWIDPQGWATSVKFSPNGEELAIGLNSGDIQLWDWVNENKTTTLEGHSEKISRILFSNNGLMLYSASFDQHVIVWNLLLQKSVQDINAHSNPINDIAVSKDGRTLVSCADDQLIRVWDLSTSKKIYEIPFSGKVEAVAISSDDNYLAAGGEAGYIRQWDLRTRQLRTDPIPVKERIWSLQYIEKDTKLISGIDNGAIRIYNAAQVSYDGISLNFEIKSIPTSLKKIFGLEFELDSYTISDEIGNNIISIRWDGEVRNKNLTILGPFYDSFDRLDISNDGKILAAGGKRGITSVWEVQTNQIIYQDNVILPLGDPISPDGLSMVVATQGLYQSIRFSDTNEKKSLSGAIPDGVVNYTNDGELFISSNLIESKVWDYSSGYEIYFTGYANNGCWVTESANNSEIIRVNSAAGGFQTWDDKSKNICAKSLLYRNSISAISGDLELLAYQNANGLIEGFSTSLNQVLWKYKPDSKVSALAVSPDSSVVAVGNEVGIIIFIDGKSGEQLFKIIGNFGSVQAIEYSNNGKIIATAGDDGITRLFGVIEKEQ